MNNNNGGRGEYLEKITKMKWFKIITILAFVLVIPALGFFSFVSFLQTQDAVKSLGESKIIFAGIDLAVYLPFVAALIIQYGQNVALFLGQSVIEDEKIGTVNLFLFEFDISTKKIAYTVFGLFAFIDALTNIVWFVQNGWDERKTAVAFITNALMLAFMIVAVIFEEVIGLCIQGLSKAVTQFGQILQTERRLKRTAAPQRSDEGRTPFTRFVPETDGRRSAQPSLKPEPVDFSQKNKNESLQRRERSTPQERVNRPVRKEPSYHQLIFDESGE